MSIERSLVGLEALARFKAMRLERGESADEFGAFVSVSGSTVHRWENPRSDSNPSSRVLIQICLRCDISPTWLLFGVGVKRLSDVPRAVQGVDNVHDADAMASRIASAAASLERLEEAIEKVELKCTVKAPAL